VIQGDGGLGRLITLLFWPAALVGPTRAKVVVNLLLGISRWKTVAGPVSRKLDDQVSEILTSDFQAVGGAPNRFVE